MIVYENNSGLFSVDNLTSESLIPVHSITKGEPVSEDQIPLPTGPYCYVNLVGDEKEKIIESAPGVTCGGHIYVWSDKAMIQYTDDLTFTMHPVGDSAPILKLQADFTRLSPLGYESCITAEMCRSRPTGYITTPSAAVWNFASGHFHGLPRFERGVFNRHSTIALFGDGLEIGPMIYQPSTDRGALALFLNRGCQGVSGKLDRYGMYFADKSVPKKALDNWRSGLTFNVSWAKNYSLPGSDAVTLAQTLCLMGLVPDEQLPESVLIIDSVCGKMASDFSSLKTLYECWYLGVRYAATPTIINNVPSSELDKLNEEINAKMVELRNSTVKAVKASVSSASLKLIDKVMEWMEKHSDSKIRDHYVLRDWIKYPSGAAISDKTSTEYQLAPVGQLVEVSKNGEGEPNLVVTDAVLGKLDAFSESLKAAVSDKFQNFSLKLQDSVPPTIIPPSLTGIGPTTEEDVWYIILPPFVMWTVHRSREVVPCAGGSNAWVFDQSRTSWWPELKDGRIIRWMKSGKGIYLESGKNNSTGWEAYQEGIREWMVNSVTLGAIDPKTGKRGKSTVRIAAKIACHPSWLCRPGESSTVYKLEKEYIKALLDELKLSCSIVDVGCDPVAAVEKLENSNLQWFTSRRQWEWAYGEFTYLTPVTSAKQHEFFGANERDNRSLNCNTVEYLSSFEYVPAHLYECTFDLEIDLAECARSGVGNDFYDLTMANKSAAVGAWLTNKVKQLGISDIVPMSKGSGVYQMAGLLGRFGQFAFSDEVIDKLKATINDAQTVLKKTSVSNYSDNTQAFLDELDKLRPSSVRGNAAWIKTGDAISSEGSFDPEMIPLYWRFC